MGMFYLVEPFDEGEREFLEEEGAALPPGGRTSRNPTPAEIRAVCDALEGFGVEYTSSARKKFWQANVHGLKGGDRNRATLLNIDKWGGSENGRYKIMFEKGDPSLILQIVQALSKQCGPLVVVPDSDVPAVVWPEANLKKLLRKWGG